MSAGADCWQAQSRRGSAAWRPLLWAAPGPCCARPVPDQRRTARGSPLPRARRRPASAARRARSQSATSPRSATSARHGAQPHLSAKPIRGWALARLRAARWYLAVSFGAGASGRVCRCQHAGDRVGVPGPGAYEAGACAALQAPAVPAYPFGARLAPGRASSSADTPVRSRLSADPQCGTLAAC